MNGDLFSGVVFDPLKNELFVAEKNKGSFINGAKIHVSITARIEDAFIATGFPYNLKDNPDKCMDRFAKVMKIGIPSQQEGLVQLHSI